MDPFALPCHPELAVGADDRDWRAIGVRSADDVRRKTTRCPQCRTDWTAYLRRFGPHATTVEWVRPAPFRVVAAPLVDDPALPVWQDPDEPAGDPVGVPDGDGRAAGLAELQGAVAGLGPPWERSAQLVTPVHRLTAAGVAFAEPGDLLLERREKWNAQDRRLALLWAPRLQRQVVAWHGFARLVQEPPQTG